MLQMDKIVRHRANKKMDILFSSTGKLRIEKKEEKYL